MPTPGAGRWWSGGYVPSEYELSVALLERFVERAADVGELAEWGRAHAGERAPGREEREALLRKRACPGRSV